MSGDLSNGDTREKYLACSNFSCSRPPNHLKCSRMHSWICQDDTRMVRNISRPICRRTFLNPLCSMGVCQLLQFFLAAFPNFHKSLHCSRILLSRLIQDANSPRISTSASLSMQPNHPRFNILNDDGKNTIASTKRCLCREQRVWTSVQISL